MSWCLCPSCHLPALLFSPLPCADCRDSLLISPPICPRCLGLTCERDACLRPWVRVDGDDGLSRFDSVDAAYLSIGPGAKILKSWKRAPSPALSRTLFPEIRRKVSLALPAGTPTILVPVPQSAKRKWELSGGSVIRTCELILQARQGLGETTIWDFLELEADPGERSPLHQSHTKGDQRYTRRSRIRGDTSIEARFPTQSHARVVLVDDFLTSGATLRAAAVATRETLEKSGRFDGRRTRLGVFVLGFRPTLFPSE